VKTGTARPQKHQAPQSGRLAMPLKSSRRQPYGDRNKQAKGRTSGTRPALEREGKVDE